MINQRDVVTIRIPFPDIASTLAVRSHMHICFQPGIEKQLLKIQTYKHKHDINMPCKNYIILQSNSYEHPCRNKSIIDLDKLFLVNNIRIPRDLLAERPISENIYNEIKNKLENPLLENLDNNLFIQINTRCTFF